MSSVTVTNAASPVTKVVQNPIDNQVIRIMRGNEITFVAKGLLPDTNAQVFLDDTRVNRFVQQANKLTVTASSMGVPFYQDEEIINNTTSAYAKVITTSNNFIYINQNFINLNVKPYGAGSLSSTTFADKDVVFQTDTNTRTGVITFVGTIERYTFQNTSAAAVAINPINGGFRPDPDNVLFLRTSASPIANVASLMRGTNGDLFPASSTIRSLANAAKTATVSTREHYSGIITYYSGSGSVVHVSSNVMPINPVGKEFRIVGGGSTGQVRTIVSSTANGIILTLSGGNLPLLSSNSKYTIGDPNAPGSVGIGEVDDYGVYCGIFHIPEYADAYFATGKRLFTVTDGFSPKDNQYKMRAFNFYNVEGRSPITQPESEYGRTPVLTAAPSNPIASSAADSLGNNKKFNPLSQTFFTPRTSTTTTNGVANSLTGLQISGIDVYFAEKPTNADLQLPVTLSIVPVVSDLPSPSVVLGQSVVAAKDVKVSTIPDAANSSTATTFKFVPPVIVQPGTEYALTLTSSSPDYAVFVAEIGGNILGTTPARRVSQQPYIGDFYKAQNASLWTPIPNEDLMFRVRYGSYTTSNTIYFVPENVLSNTNVDAFVLNTTDYNFKPTAVNYSFKSTKVDGTADSGFTSLRRNTTYDFGADLITSTKTSNRRRKLVAGNRNSFNVKVDLSTADSYVSPAIDMEKISLTTFEYEINDAGISSSDISFTNLGNHISATNITINFSSPDRADGVKANAYVAGLSAVNANAISIVVVDNPGSGYYTTPTITFSEPSAPVNAVAVVAGETGKSGGNAKARYVSRTITLADGFDAGDLRVFLDCNRPVGTDVLVYYKVRSSSDPENFEDKKWQLMQRPTNLFSKDKNEIISLEYRPSLTSNVLSYVENGVTYPLGGKFRNFAVKVVMTAKDPSVTPYVTNIKAIAVPAG